MFNKVKKVFSFYSKDENEKENSNHNGTDDSVDLDSDSDSIDIFDKKSQVVEKGSKSKYKIEKSGKESEEILSKISCICIGCGDDQSEYIMGGETEVFSVKLRRESRESKESNVSAEKSNITNSGDNSSDRLNAKEKERIMTILSPENLCLKCEISEYPVRFHGCAFCRRPLRNIFACSTCRIGFAEWVKEVIHPDTMILSGIRKQAQKIVSGIIESGYIENREFLRREDHMMFEWPGFYVGMSNLTDRGETEYYLPTWIIPESLTVNEKSKSLSISKDITLTKITKFEMFEKKLLAILEENGIYLYSNVQIDLKTFDKSNIREINPYDTSILK